ncbi:hypothetical protein Bca101_000512 [Brassica carinata]
MRSVVLCMHQRFIGKVKHAVFHTQKTGRKRVIVSTEENVVASLDLRLGDIFWRHVLGTKDAIDGVDIALEKCRNVITLSSQGSMLRAWNLPDGQMVWETSLHRAQHSKSLLFLVPILALGKRFVDPRRTLNPSQAEKEEGIIPLTDSLPVIPQSYVTHSLKVEGLRGIVTAPAKLESTTHVFAYGVDLFYTRLAPSKTYDSLTDDFSYALLLITIVALVAAIYITWILSKKKELSEKWSSITTAGGPPALTPAPPSKLMFMEKKTRKMHISFCETPSNVSVNDSELKSDMNATTPIYSKGKYNEIIREVFSYLKKFGYDT